MANSKKIYFIADIHLGNRFLKNAAEAERKLTLWLDDIMEDAAAVYFLGDIFDFWFEYKYVAPRGHLRFLGRLAEMSDRGIEIHFLIGNHDIWMFDYLADEAGIIIHHKPFTAELLGKNFFLGHGDEIGYRPFNYRFIQSIFHNRVCQILFAAIHPRWSVGFARSWSLKSRKSGTANNKIQRAQTRNVKALEDFTKTYLLTHPDINFFIFGHLHLLLDRELAATEHLNSQPDSELSVAEHKPNHTSARLIIVGDWMYQFSYAVWDGDKMILNRFAE